VDSLQRCGRGEACRRLVSADCADLWAIPSSHGLHRARPTSNTSYELAASIVPGAFLKTDKPSVLRQMVYRTESVSGATFDLFPGLGNAPLSTRVESNQ
jgi:hypothetical protein